MRDSLQAGQPEEKGEYKFRGLEGDRSYHRVFHSFCAIAHQKTPFFFFVLTFWSLVFNAIYYLPLYYPVS